MLQDTDRLLTTIKQLQKSMEQNINNALKNINAIESEAVREYLKNSINLAKKGELNLTGFLENANKLIKDANGDNHT